MKGYKISCQVEKFNRPLGGTVVNTKAVSEAKARVNALHQIKQQFGLAAKIYQVKVEMQPNWQPSLF